LQILDIFSILNHLCK